MFYKRNILVIEDNSKWRKEIREILSDAGYNVIDVMDYVSAMEEIESGKYFDLIVLDLQLGHDEFSAEYYKGWKILEEIRQNPKISLIPTLIITGHPEEYLDWRKSKKTSADSFVSKKNFDKYSFLERIENLLTNK